MVTAAATLLVIAWLPGAVMFRLPLASRAQRAALAAEERLFWQVMLSLATTLSITLALGPLHRYAAAGHGVADLLLSAALAVAARFDLRLRAPRPAAWRCSCAQS